MLTEYLLTDLALATHGIPSFTLSSLSLLSEVLETHPPSAIVTDASFLPQLLELIYDSAEGEHHTVVVVGDTVSTSGPEHVKLFKWAELELDGSSGAPVETSRPGRYSLAFLLCTLLMFEQTPMRRSPFPSSRTPAVICKLFISPTRT
jgi:hypothetical protein